MSVLLAASLHLMVKPSQQDHMWAVQLSAQHCTPAELAAPRQQYVSLWPCPLMGNLVPALWGAAVLS